MRAILAIMIVFVGIQGRSAEPRRTWSAARLAAPTFSQVAATSLSEPPTPKDPFVFTDATAEVGLTTPFRSRSIMP
jgi:hypothetical protein